MKIIARIAALVYASAFDVSIRDSEVQLAKIGLESSTPMTS